jgi:site-specific recombinase XerD
MTTLRQRMLEDMQVRNLSPHTQRIYLEHITRFARYFRRSPADLGPEEIRAYQLYLRNDRQLAVTSIHVAVAALRFLSRVTLKKAWVIEDVIPAPRVRRRLPVVLSPEEVVRFLDCLPGLRYRAMLATCYGASLRIPEVLHAVGEEAEGANAVEAGREDVKQEAPDDPTGVASRSEGTCCTHTSSSGRDARSCCPWTRRSSSAWSC